MTTILKTIRWLTLLIGVMLVAQGSASAKLNSGPEPGGQPTSPFTCPQHQFSPPSILVLPFDTCYYPAASISANPNPVQYPNGSTVSASVVSDGPGDSCDVWENGNYLGAFTADGNGNGNGSWTRYLSPGSYQEHVQCPANGLTSDAYTTLTVNNAPPPPPAQVTSFKLSLETTFSSDSVSATWTSNYATSCNLDGNPSSGGSWDGAPANDTSGWGSNPLQIGTQGWQLVCNGPGGSSSAAYAYVGVFDTKEEYVGFQDDANVIQNWLPPAVTNCAWATHSHTSVLSLHFGLIGGGITQQLMWCHRDKTIRKVIRSISIIGPNYPLSNWNFDGLVSLGPCSTQDCSDLMAQYGQNYPTSIDITVEGHWGLCQSFGFLGSLCVQDVYRTVGTDIKGDGTYADTNG